MSNTVLCCKHGILYVSFYKLRSKCAGVEVSDPKKLRALDDENDSLKKLIPESMMDFSTLKEMLGKTSKA